MQIIHFSHGQILYVYNELSSKVDRSLLCIMFILMGDTNIK